MINPFKLKGTFGADYNVDGDDILRTKTALSKLGHFEEKEFVNPYADQRMIDGLKGFQRSRGLKADGVMKPDGPTAHELGKVLAEQRPAPRQRSIVAKERYKPTPRPLQTFMPTREPHRPQPRPWNERLPTEDSLFRLLGDIGRDRRNDPRDVVTIRRALGWTGDLAPKTGLDEIRADEDLFTAIDRFQTRAGVKRDGWMGKDGETETALNAEMARKVKAQGSDSGHGSSDGTPNEGDTEVAYAGPLARVLLQTLPAVGAAIMGGKAAEDSLKGGRAGPSNDRREMTEPPAPVPPGQPPELKVPDRTETPAKAPIVEMDLSRPIPEASEPTIFVTPVPPKEFSTGTVLEIRKERPETKEEIDVIRDGFLGANKKFSHVWGGRDAETGEEKKELTTRGPGAAFPRPGRKRGDGRKLSGRPDLTFAHEDGKTFVHIQHVDIDKNGKVASHELENAEQIRKNLVNDDGKVHHILLYPKRWQMRKFGLID